MNDRQLVGIGGWLILVAIGIVLTPIGMIMELGTYPEIFSEGIWEVLTTPESNAYHPLWAPLIIGEILINAGLLIAWLNMGFKFFTGRRDFPKWFIGIAIFSLAFIIVDALGAKIVLPNEPVFDPEAVQQLIRALIAAAIWVPYMLVSKRVARTFVN